MESANLWDIHDATHRRRLNRSTDGRVLAQRQVSPGSFIVVEVGFQDAPPDCLAKLARKLLPRCPSDDLGSWPGKLQRLGFKTFAKSPYTGLAVQQVKEKFGTLRFYCGGTEAIDKYIHMAERLSAITCESCGKPGKAYDSGWIRTLCDSCRNNGHLQ